MNHKMSFTGHHLYTQKFSFFGQSEKDRRPNPSEHKENMHSNSTAHDQTDVEL